MSSPQPKKSRSKWILENVVSLALALLLVFMIRSSVVEAFKIPSGSMIPTLLVGDHIFVNKFAYGLKVPFSDVVTGRPIYLYKRGIPQRGDIVVFLYPRDESFYYIKRVVGLPGDRIEIRNKELFINGERVPRAPAPENEVKDVMASLDDPKYSPDSLELYKEKLGDVVHDIMLDKHDPVGTNFSMETGLGYNKVPDDMIFVMGDNRDYSNDSRFWGFVPLDNVKGRAMVIWLSIWVNFSEGKFVFRPSRIGTVLHHQGELPAPETSPAPAR